MTDLLASKIPTESMVKKLIKELTRERDNSILSGIKMEKFVTDFYLVQLDINLGLRISEMAALTWGDVFDEYVIVRKGKGGKARTVYFGEATKLLLLDFKLTQIEKMGRKCLDTDGLFVGLRGQLGRFGVHERFLYWKERVGLPSEITFHSLRHYYATFLLENEISLAMLKAQLGHVSIRSTSIYLHHTKSARAKLQKVM